ncbi:hypothetical protein L873DRAFT_634367 [Choiromyces venosus 120613-1]|uniref:Uncharacterized protein n=1 Tax=Choiromyces venosus 120613-1 TaxID=1336337 RepID=A0A3N4JTB9_9PEZI|nr:hypothetical protein L873DRAFT_634367 [Choiromyces venosus 120613-1]
MHPLPHHTQQYEYCIVARYHTLPPPPQIYLPVSKLKALYVNPAPGSDRKKYGLVGFSFFCFVLVRYHTVVDYEHKFWTWYIAVGLFLSFFCLSFFDGRFSCSCGGEKEKKMMDYYAQYRDFCNPIHQCRSSIYVERPFSLSS